MAHRFTPVLLAAAIALLAPLHAAEMQTPLAFASIAELEARAPTENQYPKVDPRFHQEVVRLVESNILATGDDFFRAANIASGPFPEYRSFRMRYELMLVAAAKGKREAENQLPSSWDALLQTLGRPMRYDVWDQIQKSPDDDRLTLDPAPKAVQMVMLHPDDARNAAAKGPNNAEVQKIVDADQEVRKRLGQLSETELKAMPIEDHQRNLRIRAIINSGELHTAGDFENASLVMQHSSSFAGFELAHELAVCSMLLGDRGVGRWLVAATYDRMLNSIGHDQRFGTQGALMAMGNAKPHLAETDETGICDGERLALGCPTLAAKRADFYTRRPND
jgi:hypothetical protein